MPTQIKSRQIFDLSNVIAPKYAATKAAGTTLATTLPDGAIVFVSRDESSTPAGAMVRYVVSGGLLTTPVLNTVANEQANGDINFYRSNNTVPITLSAGGTLLSTAPLSGATTVAASQNSNTVQSAVTVQAAGYSSTLNTQATTFTLGSMRHFHAVQGTFGAGSTVTEQTGFWANSNLIGATTNYGFMSNIPAGTGRWNFYAQGTAQNLFAGVTHVGEVNPQRDINTQASIASSTGTTGLDVSVASTSAGIAGLLGFTKYSAGTFNTAATGTNHRTGAITFSGYDGTTRQSSAQIFGFTGSTWTAGNTSQMILIGSTGEGTTTPLETMRLHGPLVITYQGPEQQYAGSTTLLATDLQSGIVQKPGTAAVTFTFPTGTSMETVTSLMQVNTAFNWSIINSPTGAITIAPNTNHSIVGSTTIAANASGSFRTRKTATNVFVTYRVA